MSPSLIAKNLQSTLESVLPRILTQACRDSNNPAYGCFDRNWWHYRIRDFASIILQQGGYTVLKASEVCDTSLITEDFAQSIAAGSCRFWNARASRHGSFEEYYPWEQGYPPVAFSTLAIAKLVSEGIIPESEIHKGLSIAAKQLSTRFEPKAANQQIAGLAALAWVKKVSPSLVSDADFAKQKEKSLALQTDEGWYWEYDGPDIGYLSVTIDCLWDLFDATGDQDFRKSADKALQFIHDVITLPGCGLGMLNARNTDYVVPYGISRYLSVGTPEQRSQAASILETLYFDTDSPTHFFKAIDDRYWCHYIGHSVARAVAVLKRCGNVPTQAPTKSEVIFPTAGYVFKKIENNAVLTLALNKGACVRVTQDGKSAFDFGWLVDTGKKQYVSHWWSLDWIVSIPEEQGLGSEKLRITNYELRIKKNKVCPHSSFPIDGASPSDTAPQEPHLNAGVAESARVQAMTPPASNDAPSSSPNPVNLVNPVKKALSPHLSSVPSCLRGEETTIEGLDKARDKGLGKTSTHATSTVNTGPGVPPAETTHSALRTTHSLQTTPSPQALPEEFWTVSGTLVAHKEATSSPFMHLALRLLSLVFGKSIIGILKKVMIFKKNKSPYTFTRTVKETPEGIAIEDTITGLSGTEKISPAPRASKRHVASADSFSTEDFNLQSAFLFNREEKRTGDKFEAVTLIRFSTEGDLK